MMLVNQIVILIASLLAIGQFAASVHLNETTLVIKEADSASTTSAPSILLTSVQSPTTESKSAPITTESPIFSLEVVNEPTSKPTEIVTESPQVKVNSTDSSISISPHDEKEKAILPKFCDYLKPICAGLDEIQPKQLFRFQTQFKQFVQLTNGKLGLCFLEHYEFDPTLKPLTKQDLVRICHSKDVSPNLKGSIKKFETCAANNWDPSLDKELTRIIDARLNCIKNHNHTGKASSNSSLIEHEDDEDMSLINDVVNKVLNEEKNSASNKSDVNIIDMLTKSNTTSGSHTTLSSEAKKALSDPNTVLVFVDDSPSSKTTIEPTAIVQKTTTPVPHSSSKVPPTSAHTTIQPSVDKESDHKEENVVLSTKNTTSHEVISLKTTEKPTEVEVVKVKSAIPNSSTKEVTLTSLLKSDNSSLQQKSLETENSHPKASSEKVEVIILTTTTKPTVIVKAQPVAKLNQTPLKELIKPSTTVPPTKIKVVTESTKSIKSWETLESILRRQEKEKLEFEAKLRAERENAFKMLQKKQDESDAQSAIKSLQQQQREASVNHNTDNKLHQLEHERQMAIDPIGHTIKHQQYEINKRLAGTKI